MTTTPLGTTTDTTSGPPPDPADAIGAVRQQLPAVRDHLASRLPTGWDTLDEELAPLVDRPLGPLASIPMAGCLAVGGTPERAVPVAAAWIVLNQAIRILDDLQDRDRPDATWSRLGPARTFNLAGGLFAFSQDLLLRGGWPSGVQRQVSAEFTDGALLLAAGQDRDLRGRTRSMVEYWHTVREKNGRAFAMASAAGARCGTDDVAMIDACRTFGQHLGIALQLLDDLEGICEPPDTGTGDLERGVITLPTIWAATAPHPGRARVRSLLHRGVGPDTADELRLLISRSGARGFTVRCALEERAAAVAALAPCHPGGRAALTAYVSALFADLDELLDPSPGPQAVLRSTLDAARRRPRGNGC